MTTIPQPGSPTASYTATYDAWHRLVKLANGGTTVAEYEYDATKQRIAKKVYASGVLDYEHHYYYNENWQVLETFPETGENEELPVASYVWHPYYIDALLLRDYDEDADGIVVRYYYTQDVNFNVLSILSSTGTVLERYGYTPYGQAEVLTASFTADSDGLSDSDNDVTFTGQRFDAESKLMLYRHRYYHPVIGTFCSRDPIGYEGSEWSLYEYVGGRATAGLDASGLSFGPGGPFPRLPRERSSASWPYFCFTFSGIGHGVCECQWGRGSLALHAAMAIAIVPCCEWSISVCPSNPGQVYEMYICMQESLEKLGGASSNPICACN